MLYIELIVRWSILLFIFYIEYILIVVFTGNASRCARELGTIVACLRVSSRALVCGTDLFTTVLTYDDGQAEDEENSLPHLDGFQSKLPPGILPHGLPQVKEVQPAITQVEKEKEKEKPKEGQYHGIFVFIFFEIR